jgi:hypothetical protein
MDALIDYCCSQPGMLVVPIDVLSEQGLDPEAAAAYQDRGLLSAAECRRINEMIATYWVRAETLRRASKQWFPPRVQHLCLVTDGVATRPYFQPFHASSWLLYREDLGEATSSLEFSIFLLFQAERQYLQQQVGASLTTNLGYLQVLNPAQYEDFVAGCRRSTRPDAEGYRALADALPGLRGLCHVDFDPPTEPLTADHRVLANGLVGGPDAQRAIDALHHRWMAAIEGVAAAHRASVRPSTVASGRHLSAWLESESPQLVLTGKDKALLWHGPGTANPSLEALLVKLTPEAEQSILLDLQVIDRKSRMFIDALTEPDALAAPAAWMTEGGLSYIHGERRRIAYSLTDDPGRLWQASPPYERLMLAARTVHEWGHQAAESGWVDVDPSRRGEREAEEEALVELLDRIVDALPGALRPALLNALGKGTAGSATPGQRLMATLLRRIDDYMANLVARQFLSDEEMDTYVRNNVGSRLLDYAPEQALVHLLRMAYEFQYLKLARIRDPETWFLRSSWFDVLFAETGVATRDRFFELTECVGRICGSYRIDPGKIRLPSGVD